MAQLFRYWLDLCLLRTAPQDGPSSAFILGFSLTGYAMISVLVLTGSYGMLDGARLAFMDLVVMTAFVAVILYLTGKTARILQTLSAMAGSGSVINMIALPLVLLGGSAANAGSLPVALSLVWLLLAFWNLVICAHIIRHALSASLVTGIAVSFLYMLISIQFATTVLPQPDEVTVNETTLNN